MTKKQYISIGITILCIGALGMLLLMKKNKTIQQTSTATSTTQAITLPDGSVIYTTGGAKIEQVPIEDKKVSVPVPDIQKPIVYLSTIDPRVKEAVETNVAKLRDMLTKNPRSFEAWIDLGTNYKVAGDYNQAIVYWTYASKLAPSDFISLGNIANTYAYYLKDNGMAEVYYKKAIANGKTQAYLYIQLAEVYRDVFKDVAKAKSIIAQGLVSIPNDPALLEFQKTL